MPRTRTSKVLNSLDAIMEIAEDRRPVTVRGVAYALLDPLGLIPSMEKKHTNRVGTLVKERRESGDLPWEWIVDDMRQEVPYNFGYESAAAYIQDTFSNVYHRNYWNAQPYHVEVWSEKATVAGVLEPVLRKWFVDFRNMRGYTSATSAHEIAKLSRFLGKPFVAIYVVDWDPSGLNMSEIDLPRRIEAYGGQVTLIRAALSREDTLNSVGLPLEGKSKDPRYEWYRREYGANRFWELDGLDPRILRERIDNTIASFVDHEAWNQCMAIEEAEHSNLAEFLNHCHASRVLFGL